MRARYVTMRVYVDGRLSHKIRMKRTVRSSRDGDYVLLHGRRQVVWRNGSPTVDVYRNSMLSLSRGDSPESIGAHAGRQGVLPQMQYRNELGSS
jgi:hypothetical protein